MKRLLKFNFPTGNAVGAGASIRLLLALVYVEKVFLVVKESHESVQQLETEYEFVSFCFSMCHFFRIIL